MLFLVLLRPQCLPAFPVSAVTRLSTLPSRDSQFPAAMAQASTMDEPVRELTKMLEKYQVPNKCIEYITKAPAETEGGLGLSSISDFASAWTEKDYAEGVKQEIVMKVPDCKNCIVQATARVRTAWMMASAELEKAKKRKVEGAPDADWDTPLEDEEENARKKAFADSYGELHFDTESTPGASLMGRWYREFRSQQRHVSLTSLHKMRSEADYKQLGTVKRQELSKGLSLVQDGTPTLPDIYFDSVLKLMEAFKLMTNGWALTGYAMVDSKVEFDQSANQFKRVRNCHLGQAIAYYDFVFRKALEYRGNDDAKVRWLLERDRQTRSKAKSLYATGWPWGEAIHAAKDTHCLVLWTIGNQGANAMNPKAVLPELEGDGEQRGGFSSRQKQRQRKGKGKGKGRCPKFNSPAGCTRNQSKCPLGLPHRCSKPGCDMTNHGASSHREQR